MADQPDQDQFQKALQAISRGDESAFGRAYGLYHARARLVAWRVSHRADWVDDIVNEAWCRAFAQRKTYDPDRPFLVWMAGIIQNVYREHCRQSRLTVGEGSVRPDIDHLTPEALAGESELLSGLHECMARLNPEEARILRLRYFESKPLRVVAKEVNIAESTLRDGRLPVILQALRRCMEKKGLDIPEFFSAQEGPPGQ